MAPTPILATHRIAIKYTPATLQHTMNLFVDAVPTATGDASGYDAVSHVLANPNVGMTALVTTMVNVLKGDILTTGSIDDWTLYHKVGVNYVPLYSNTLAVAGTSGASAGSPAGQYTNTYRTGLYEKAAVVLFELPHHPPIHDPIGGTGPLDLIGLMFVDRAAGKPGNFIVGRDDTIFATAKNITGSLNKKIRRKLNLV